MASAIGTPEARRELRDLRVEERADLGLAAIAIGLALVATQVAATLALPLFLGGLVIAVLGGRACFRRWDLSERLLLDPDAYEIAEIRDRAAQFATLQERRRLAWSIRGLLAEEGTFRASRVEAVAEELAQLAEELDDEHLVLEPICAAHCRLLLTDSAESPLLNPDVPPDGLRIALTRIRAGFDQQR
jgi:hypothetical protein